MQLKLNLTDLKRKRKKGFQWLIKTNYKYIENGKPTKKSVSNLNNGDIDKIDQLKYQGSKLRRNNNKNNNNNSFAKNQKFIQKQMLF